MFDQKPLTNKELQIFRQQIQKTRNGPLRSYYANDKCIANALCRVGSQRNQPMCGTYVCHVEEGLTKIIHREFSDEEMGSIVLACTQDEIGDGISDSSLPEEMTEKLSAWVPVFMSRKKN